MTVKLIASDLDGTLLQGGAQSLSSEAIPVIREVVEQGVIFVPASGRQWPNLERKFSSVANDISYICENGALVVAEGKVIYKSVMPREEAEKLAQEILDTEELEVVISGERTSYLIPKKESYVSLITDVVKNNVRIIESMDEIKEPIIKISLYRESGLTEYDTKHITGKFQHVFKGVTSGFDWFDFMNIGTNKGTAIKILQDYLGVTKEETMAFGDNDNDIEMMQAVAHSYAMENGKEALKNICRYRCVRVEDTLKELYQIYP